MARRRRAAGAGAGPGAATNRFQFREELGGLKVMGVDFWSGVQAILPCPAPAQRPCGLACSSQERMMIGCWVEVGAASTSTTTAIHYSLREEWTC